MLSTVSFVGKSFHSSHRVAAINAGFNHVRSIQALPSSSLLISEAVNAWSVAGTTLSSADIASTLFSTSLLPYLVLLYFLEKDETKTPALSKFGFQFLLVFVFATIPAGIYAKTEYHDILANIDWLHGTAESLLTVTNLFIIFGFRGTRSKADNTAATTGSSTGSSNSIIYDLGLPVLLLLGAIGNIDILSSLLHIEPSNALSLPTWAVHSSSILEWLIAMKLIWEHATTSGNPRWKGMTLAMIISHVSGLCACTFHFFYNNPSLNWIVILQALTTVLGNSAMALAAYRIYSYEKRFDTSYRRKEDIPLPSSDVMFSAGLLVKAFAVAAAVKYGELLLPYPFELSPDNSIAAAMIALPVIQNAWLWVQREKQMLVESD